MDIVLALALFLFGRQPMRPLPYTAPHAHIQTIPDPLPYAVVLDERTWGA